MKSGPKKSKFLFVLISIIFVFAVYTILPTAALYIQKTPETTGTNLEKALKFKGNASAPFSFIAFGDTSSGLFLSESATLKLVSRMNREDRFKKTPIDFVVNLGDVTFRGRESHYKNYAKIRGKIKYPVIDVMGNHDDDYEADSSKGALFRKYCGESEFSFKDRNSYFIVLNNKDGEFSEKQFEQFERYLAEGSECTNIFVFMHKPPFNPCQESWYRIETCPWSLRFMKLCEKYRVKAVFSGHEHVSRVAEFGGVKYFIAGGGGSLMVDSPDDKVCSHHYVVVKVNGDYIDYEIRRVSPPVWLYLTFYMWRDLIYSVKGLLN